MSHDHRLLGRQLAKMGLSAEKPPQSSDQWREFLDRVSKAYNDYDEDRYLLERSLDVSAQEMKDRFHKINLLVDQLQCNQGVLSNLIHDRPIEKIMGDLVVDVESRLNGFKGAIFSVEPGLGKLKFLAGPSLPASITEMLASGQVPPAYCPCHQAMEQKIVVSVVTEGVSEKNSMWRKMGIGACHAFPVLDDAGVVVAVFALYASDRLPLRVEESELMSSLSQVVQMTFSFLEIKEALNRENMASIARSKLQTLGELAGGVAHEINNPLFILQGYIDVIRAAIEDKQLDPGELSTICESMSSNVHRVAKIVNTLRTFSRDGSRDPLEPVRVKTLIEDAMELSSKRYDEVRFEVNMSEADAESVVLCRPIEIVQVVINLLNNAYYAVKNEENAWVQLEVRRAGQALEVRVTDSGHGIDEAVVKQLFQPFVTTKPVGEGTGLGLSISKRIMESHEGQLFYNAKNPNTQFVMQLPILNQVAA